MTDNLIQWKSDPDRKPLVLQGIRHCGKSFLLRDFGEKYFKNILYFDFSADKNLADLFIHVSNVQSLLKNLSVYSGRDINPAETLIIFKEIILCPAAMESLKLFADTKDDLYITATASFLNVYLSQGLTIPFGYIRLQTLYPMNFYEFLLAQSPMLALHLKESGFTGEAYTTFKRQLEDKFNDYQIIGGMPEVVKSWIETQSIETAESLQLQIIKSFESEFTTFCPVRTLPKLFAVWNAIPSQLVKGNRKFMFSKIKKSWRGNDLDDAIFLLMRAGLIYKTEHISKPEVPVSGYVDASHFKLYLCDAGLLRRLGGFRSSIVISRDSSYSEIKSVIVENIACSELIRIFESNLYYWSAENPGKAEVDFIVADGDMLIPVEVKAGSASKARSLLQYRSRFAVKKYVLTGTDTDKDDILPIYGFWNLKEWLKINS